MTWLGLDIGGANVKVADGCGYARSYPLPLWRELPRLPEQIRIAIEQAPMSQQLAITMTGELADCFASKAAGVRSILQAVKLGAGNRHTLVYLTDGRLVSPHVALNDPALAAASNWHALAAFAGRYAISGEALLIDIGSTTCDVVALVDGRPATQGTTDTQRLLSGELVYTGIERSPVCAVLQTAPYRGALCPVTQELFATMADVYLVLERLTEEPENTATADGQPATSRCAVVRLGRMLAADATEFDSTDAVALAHAAAQSQAALVARGIARVLTRFAGPPRTLILSGHGEFLARAALSQFAIPAPFVILRDELGEAVSRCAPAHAVAVLAREWAVSLQKDTRGELMIRVVKIGGILLDWPELPVVLQGWLSQQPAAANVLICGGGVFAEGVRGAATVFSLDDETAHWLSIDCLTITAKLLARLLSYPAVQSFFELTANVQSGFPATYVFDPVEFLKDFEQFLPPPALPHDWSTTSDSIAARVAVLLGADELVLLKSRHAPSDDLSELAAVGFVDRHFAVAAAGICQVCMVNLREHSTCQAPLPSQGFPPLP